MVTTAFIKLWGETVGAVVWDEEQQLGIFRVRQRVPHQKLEPGAFKNAYKKVINVFFPFPELRPLPAIVSSIPLKVYPVYWPMYSPINTEINL